MLGAVLKPEYAGRVGEVLDHAAASGWLLLQVGSDVLRFVPTLNIGDAEVVEGLARLESALKAFAGRSSFLPARLKAIRMPQGALSGWMGKDSAMLGERRAAFSF